MQKELQLRVTPEVAATDALLKEAVAAELGTGTINGLRTLSRSIDARQRRVMIQLRLRAYIGEPMPQARFQPIAYGDVSAKPQAVVVGAGPAGLFAALRLIELGVRPIVLERGKDVHTRRKDIARISREHLVNPESNYSFGEGGAGAYSDGKLYTRSKKRGSVERILRIFCQHGASTDILSDAHPHIGTDRLPTIIKRIRQQIIASGGEVRFGTRADALLFNAARTRVTGIVTQAGEEITGPVILATGHSARDTYLHLAHEHIPLEAKGTAIGVRLEHPSALIDRIQYHNREGRGPHLPAAEYNFTSQQEGRGVYSFCMCPGGFVVPAATAPGQIVVNGMSPAARNSRWSNSGMVVETHPDDVSRHMQDLFPLCEMETPAPDDPLRVMYLQTALERMAWQQGGRTQAAPAQRMTDFVNHRLGPDLPTTSYIPGATPSPLHFWLPPFITKRLQAAFRQFGKRSHGFLTAEATVLATETRTSSPVRLLRNPDTLQSPSLSGLYPCGEGAGHAGGIVSAAIDGERCAEALSTTLT